MESVVEVPALHHGALDVEDGPAQGLHSCRQDQVLSAHHWNVHCNGKIVIINQNIFTICHNFILIYIDKNIMWCLAAWLLDGIQ